VDLSGVIFVVLALVWAVVLIPKALRHHDEVARTRSVDEVSEEARVVARREAVDRRSTRLVVGPPPTPAVVEAVPAAAGRPEEPAVPTVPRQRQPVDRSALAVRRKAALVAARRRRRILGALLVLDVAVGVAALLEVVPLWWAVPPVALTLLYLVLCRTLVRREHAGWDAAVLRAGEPAAQEPPEPVAEPVAGPVAGPVAEPVAGPVVDPSPTASSPLGERPSGTLDEAEVSDAGSLWDPLPVTLPTYVGKPRATRSVRTIDLTGPGVASSGRDAADSALVAGAAAGTAQGGDPTQQRAVGS